MFSSWPSGPYLVPDWLILLLFIAFCKPRRDLRKQPVNLFWGDHPLLVVQVIAMWILKIPHHTMASQEQCFRLLSQGSDGHRTLCTDTLTAFRGLFMDMHFCSSILLELTLKWFPSLSGLLYKGEARVSLRHCYHQHRSVNISSDILVPCEVVLSQLIINEWHINPTNVFSFQSICICIYNSLHSCMSSMATVIYLALTSCYFSQI